jgi:hypothetical protein
MKAKILTGQTTWIYSGCQKNDPIAGRFIATTLMPPSFLRSIIMTSGVIYNTKGFFCFGRFFFSFRGVHPVV